MKLRRRLLRILIALLLLAGISAMSTVLLLNSEKGSNWLVRKIAEYYNVDIQTISGNLVSGLELENIRLQKELYSGAIDHLAFNWNVSALFYATVAIESVQSSGIQINIRKPENAGKNNKPAWPNINLPLILSLNNVEFRDVQLNYNDQSHVLEKISLDAEAGPLEITIEKLEIVSPDYRLDMNGDFSPRFPYRHNIWLQWQYSRLENIVLAGTALVEGDIHALDLEHELTSPVRITSKGKFISGITDDSARQVDLRNRWEAQQLPLSDLTLTSSGELHIMGWPDSYTLQGQGQLLIPDQPPLAFELDAAGDSKSMNAIKLDFDHPAGQMQVDAQLDWLSGLHWSARVSARNMNPEHYFPEWPGNLQFSALTEGTRKSGEWTGHIKQIQLNGTLRDYPVQGLGEIAFKQKQLSSESLQLQIAENLIILEGSINKNLDLKWQLRAPKLNALWPGMGGQLSTQGKISGNIKAPLINGKLSASGLVFSDYSIQELTASVATTTPEQYSLQLNATDLTAYKQNLTNLDVRIKGNPSKHRLTSQLTDNNGMATINVSGGYKNSIWQGRIGQADWRIGSSPLWTLQKPAIVNLGNESIDIKSLCWSAAEANICTTFDWSNTGGLHGSGSWSAVPANMIKPWLPPYFEIEGVVDGSFAFNQENENPSGEFILEARPGVIKIHRHEEVEQFHWKKISVQAQLKDQTLNVTPHLIFTESGNAQADLSFDFANTSLNGNAHADFNDLSLLEALFPYLHNVSGRLKLNANLDGTFNHPVLLGSLVLQQGSARIPDLGILVQNTQFEIRSINRRKLLIEGSMQSGAGNLTMQGDIDYGEWGKWNLQTTLTGEKFELIKLPKVEAAISPQLNIRLNPQQLTLKGAVRIPRVLMNIETLPESATPVSDDVIIVDSMPSDTDRNNKIQFACHIQLILGENIKFQGFGFDAGLDGQLTLIKEPERTLVTNGNLAIKTGRYKAYGQNLEIERGRLLFQGTYDNPGLDILALRKTPEVTVGLEIGGTLKNPRSRVFSEPPLPDSEAMAILLTGKSLAGASKTDASSLINAIAGLGLEKGQFIADDIARTFNLDEFKIQSENTVEESSLLIGKQISPRLFIRYIVGLFDQTSKMGLSYRLSKYLRLEAESGQNQSMDVIYEIER